MRMFLLLLFLLIPLSALSSQRYVVKEGDTLWSISDKFYKNPAYWQFVWERNREKVKNPHWIYPGQMIEIPSMEEIKDRLKGGFIEEKVVRKPLFRWEQQMFIPYITRRLPPKVGVVANEAFDPEKKLYSNGDGFNISLYKAVDPGEVLLIYRIVKRDVKDPVDGRSLGYLVQNVGIAKVEKVHEGLALGKVLKCVESVMEGDILTRFSMPDPIYSLKKVDFKVYGNVVSLQEKRDIAGIGDVVVVSVGRKDGIAPGCLLWAYLPPWDRIIAELVVLRTEDETSTCYILREERSIVIGTHVRGG